MADRKSRIYELRKMTIENSQGTSYDIRDICVDFAYYESIDSPFIRCDFTILDSTDFNKTLMGGEKVMIDMFTASSGKKPLKCELRVHKMTASLSLSGDDVYLTHGIT